MKITVIIQHPQDVNLTRQLDLTAEFSHNPETYGNGWYVSICGSGFAPTVYDLRYDTSFKDDKIGWLKNWAKNMWTGKNGSWVVKAIEV